METLAQSSPAARCMSEETRFEVAQPPQLKVPPNHSSPHPRLQTPWSKEEPLPALFRLLTHRMQEHDETVIFYTLKLWGGFFTEP